jgi:hypothetical protein
MISNLYFDFIFASYSLLLYGITRSGRNRPKCTLLRTELGYQCIEPMARIVEGMMQLIRVTLRKL